MSSFVFKHRTSYNTSFITISLIHLNHTPGSQNDIKHDQTWRFPTCCPLNLRVSCCYCTETAKLRTVGKDEGDDGWVNSNLLQPCCFEMIIIPHMLHYSSCSSQVRHGLMLLGFKVDASKKVKI